MFYKSILSALTLVTGLMSAQVNAAFIATDWKTQGDGLATLDTETGLEWLDFTQTSFKSINEVKSLLATVYTGWRMPTYAEMLTLSENLYSPQIVASLGQPNGASVSHQNKGDAHVLFGSAHQYVAGYNYGIYELNGRTMMFGRSNPPGLMHFNFDRVANYDSSNYHTGSGLDYKNVHDGVYLVSDGGTTLSSINNPYLNIKNPNAPVNQVPDVPADVPVHAGFGLLGLVLMASGLRRRKSI